MRCCLLSAAPPAAARNTASDVLSIVLLAAALLSVPTHGFVRSGARYGCVSRLANSNHPPLLPTLHVLPTFVTDRSALHATAGDKADDAIPTTGDGMKDLIVDLSKEATDDIRRSRLQSIIAQGLAEGDAETFPTLFQQALEVVGNEVQAEARELAMQRYEEKDAAETINEAAVASAPSSDSNNGESPIRVEQVNETSEGTIKSPLETQLWALVDMMVQSKTMIKKAKGQLGSKGEFR
mmetsp:Transcript_33911/g.99938  ORF Transcript_33911/g.99938 Transcript_33911/m.99938 type:complete len:238 (-) Transcript_33911:1896-2609(-)